MKRLLLFGGAAESRALLDALRGRPVSVTLCVATDYGKATLAGGLWPGLEIRTGRLDAEAIGALLRAGRYDRVLDATHPYAVQATANIRLAAKCAGVPRLRLARASSDLAGCTVVSDAGEAAARLEQTTGPVLLCTGTKELTAFTGIPDAARRLYVRVLPALESLAACLAAGVARGHILAMQGPFSAALNEALLREWSIETLVTKDGGAPGGFAQKRRAVQAVGAQMIVIGRPHDDGLPLEALLRELDAWLEPLPEEK